MKLYEFDEKRFNKYAIIYANNEAEAIRCFINNVYGAVVKYDVPKPLDIDEFFDAVKKKHTDLDSYQLKERFNEYCAYILFQKVVKRVM